MVPSMVSPSTVRAGCKDGEDSVMKFNVVFKRGATTVNTVIGVVDLSNDQITVGDLKAALAAEQVIERLTGVRVHIEQVG